MAPAPGLGAAERALLSSGVGIALASLRLMAPGVSLALVLALALTLLFVGVVVVDLVRELRRRERGVRLVLATGMRLSLRPVPLPVLA